MEKEARAIIQNDQGFRNCFSPPLPSSVTFLQYCKNEAAGSLFFTAAKQLEREDLSNEVVLHGFENIRPYCQGTNREAEVDKAISILRRMMMEQRVHVPQSGTLDDRIAEAIWQIPYHDAEQGGVLVPSPTSSQRYASVPQLIEALDDQRFLRRHWPHDSSGPPVDYRSLAWIPKVSDIAKEKLDRIFDKCFMVGGESDHNKALKDQVSRWYQAILSGGPRAANLQAVRHGGYAAEASFDIVVKDYPGEALDALLEGYRNTSKEETGLRGFFAQTMARLPGKEALTEVEKICDEAKPQWVRILACVGLVAQYPDKALPRMKREWTLYERREKYDYDHASLIGPLYHAGPEGARVLAKNLRKQPIFLRSEILTGFRIRLSSNGWPEAPKTLSREYSAVMESLFGSELGDLDQCNISIPMMENPRMCDVAMHELANMLPKTYSFNPKKALEPQRKRAIATFKNRQAEARRGSED